MALSEYCNADPIEPATPLQRQVWDVLDLRWRIIERECRYALKPLRLEYIDGLCFEVRAIR
jgi:hypothetical protein